MNAMMMAQDSSLNDKRGDLYRQGKEYNNAQKQRVSEFNRGTNQYNSDMGLRSAQANAQMQQALNQQRLSAYTTQAQMRDNIDTKMSQAKSANFSNLFGQLGALGQEELNRNMISGIPSLGYLLSRLGETQFKGYGKEGMDNGK